MPAFIPRHVPGDPGDPIVQTEPISILKCREKGLMAGVTLRISKDAHQILREISEATGEPMNSVLDKALEEYRRKRFLEKANQAFAALKMDPKAWMKEMEERRAWEDTLGDGLEKD